MRMIIAVTQAQVVITGLKVIVVATASTNTSAHTPRPRRRVTKSHLWILLIGLVVFIVVLRSRTLGRNDNSTHQTSSSIMDAITLTNAIGTIEPIIIKVIRIIKHVTITRPSKYSNRQLLHRQLPSRYISSFILTVGISHKILTLSAFSIVVAVKIDSNHV